MRPCELLVCALLAGCSAHAGGEDTWRTSQALDQCGPVTVEGIDVFDGQGSIDWAAVQADGVRFAMIKATQGTYDTQSTFSSNWAGSRAAGLRRGAYHFFDPTEDGVAQAAYFLSVVGTLHADDLPPMLDLECPDGDANCLDPGESGQAPPADIRPRIQGFLSTVEKATGKKPLVYTFASYFVQSGVDATGLDAYPLFIAYPTAGACFPVPSPWPWAVMWQYSFTGSVRGIGVAVDRDRFIGTSAGLDALAAAAGMSHGCP
jgi:lysozyme